ncbi:MAG: response regulator [Syntrophorhabdaceae bacterium]|nr:response regulator [Syntrophorhabdaceae bacterium]
MTGHKEIKILLVDDDPVFRNAIGKYLSKYPTFDVYEASDGEEGLRRALEVKPDLIISDYYMPKTDGIEFCRKVKGNPELSSAIFILLTIEKEVFHKIKGLEQGADDYIEKSTSAAVLMSKIKAFLRIKQLQNELQEEKDKLADANALLERNFKELTSILLKIIDFRVPGAADRAWEAKEAVEYICGRLEIRNSEKKKIIFGTLLHEIGKVGLPDHLVDKNRNGVSMEERIAFNQYPVIGSMITSTISGFKDAANAIYYQYENYDGSGQPEGLLGEEIPIGARILRAIVMYEELIKEDNSAEDIMLEIKLAVNKALDPAIAAPFIDFLIEKDKNQSASKQRIRLDELEPGMMIAEDIYSSSGLKLLPKGVTLQERMLQVIIERNKRDPIIGAIYVFKEE